MILNLITPDKLKIQRDSINYINLRLSDGYPISIYPGHTHLIALISPGKIKCKGKQQLELISVSEGLMIINHDIITCYVNWAEPAETLDNG